MLAARVERVDPTTIRRDGTRVWITAHDALPGGLVDKQLRKEPPRAEVVGANAIADRVLRGDMLDEVEHARARRECVEGEVPPQPDDVAEPEPVNIHDRERARFPQLRTRSDIAQDERAPVVREPPGGPVERNGRNPVVPRQEGVAKDAAP